MKRTAMAAASALATGAAHAAEPSIQSSAWQGLLGLAIVLAVILAAAWMLKRVTQVASSGRGPLQSIAALSVGPKERVVLVQCEDTWIVVGVAAGRVSALHAMHRPAGAAIQPDPQSVIHAQDTAGFRRWLEKAMARRED